LVGKSQRKYHLGDLGEDRRTITKRILEKQGAMGWADEINLG